jgi:RNA:NAD 2'-phosphotransferase (TPT1/KptA family)
MNQTAQRIVASASARRRRLLRRGPIRPGSRQQAAGSTTVFGAQAVATRHPRVQLHAKLP